MSDSLSAAAADTARLRELAEAVGTFGPWQRFGDLIAQPEVDIVYWAYRDLPPAEWDDAETRYAPLLDFIAACSPDVILALLAEVEVLRAARDDDAMKISLDHSETSVVEERLIAARRAARALLDVAEKHHPGNDWWSVGIARRHLEALLAATWLRSASLQDAAPDSDLGMRAVGRGDAGAAVLLRRAEVAEAALTEARAAFAQAREEIDETAEERDDWARAHANAQRTLATTENERNSVRAALEQAQAALEAAIRHASPAEQWIAIPHEQWRNLLAAIPHDPDLQPDRIRAALAGQTTDTAAEQTATDGGER